MSPAGGPPWVASHLAVAAMAAGVAALGQGGALLAGLTSFMVLDLTHRALLKAGLPWPAARWTSLALLALALAGGSVLLASFARNAVVTAPELLAAVIPKVLELSERYGIGPPFESVVELRELALRSIAGNLGSVTEATGIFTAGTLRIGAAVAVAALLFAAPEAACEGDAPSGGFRRELRARLKFFMAGFERVLGAQAVISLVNTILTACYLLWAGIPHLALLVPATFLLGLIPIVGNIMSNCLIIGAALTLSLQAAVLSLGFLVFIHTLEHFLNSRIVGGRIEAPMWLTLLSLVAGELLLGVPGIVIAPTLLHYVREELQAVPA